MKLGFIGLGAMGAPMARNLLKADHELALWNKSPEKVDPLVEVGARRADSPADAASGTRATILMLTNSDAVQAILFGDEGGDEQTFEEFEPVLAAMGEKISLLGELGSGARMKLINNLILGANMAVLSEGLALGEAAGIPVEKQLEVILGGGAASGVAQRRSGNLISGSYEPQFKLSHELKDLYYALELGRDLEDPLPITAVVSQIYNEGMRQHAEEDMSAVAEVYRQRINARPAQD